MCSRSWRWAREAEDFTHDKSDDKDALLTARLTAQLHCYLPGQPTAAWARPRHLGNRRVEQLTLVTAAQQRLWNLLERGWPAALEVTRHPLDSLTWRPAMTVGRCDPARIRRLGFTALPGRSPASCPAGVARWLRGKCRSVASHNRVREGDGRPAGRRRRL